MSIYNRKKLLILLFLFSHLGLHQPNVMKLINMLITTKLRSSTNFGSVPFTVVELCPFTMYNVISKQVHHLCHSPFILSRNIQRFFSANSTAAVYIYLQKEYIIFFSHYLCVFCFVYLYIMNFLLLG